MKTQTAKCEDESKAHNNKMKQLEENAYRQE